MRKRVRAAACALGVLAFTATALPLHAQESQGAVDAEAVDLLRSTMEYLDGLESFSAFVFNLREDLLDSGQRVDFESSGAVTVVRPNKLLGVRHAGAVDEVLVYDGEKVTVYNEAKQTFMTAAAPATIEEMFVFLHSAVEIYPVSDLIWQDAFPYLMDGVEFATVVGTEVIGGVKCVHLVFGRPDLGFQIWVPESGPPLPSKYVVTDHATPEMLSIVTYITDWNVEPSVADDAFTFVPPEGAKKVPFPKPDSNH